MRHGYNIFLWTSEFWWLKTIMIEEYGDRSSIDSEPFSKFAKNALLANNIEIVFGKGNHGEQRRCWSIHSDICGPSNQTSNGGKRYFITPLMIIAGKLALIFHKRSLKHFLLSKTSRRWLKKEEGPL